MDDFSPRVIARNAKEFEAGERSLVVCGDEDNFRIHPANQAGKEILLSTGSISREIDVSEAIQLADSPYCKNKDALIEFLIAINAL